MAPSGPEVDTQAQGSSRHDFHFHQFAKIQPFGSAGTFTRVRTLRKAIHGKVELHRWKPRADEDKAVGVVVKVMKNSLVNLNRGKIADERHWHFLPRGVESENAPHIEDALTEIGVFLHLACQIDCSCYLLRTLGVFADDTHTRLATEEAEGGELLDIVLQQGRLTELHVQYYIRQLVDAVAYLHSHKIAHRDISLENVLLKGGDVKLMDFGQAVRTHDVDGIPFRYFRATGKHAYRAPETYVPSSLGQNVKAEVLATQGCAVGNGPRVALSRLTETSHLCEVEILDGADVGTSVSARLAGYEAAPIDIFAIGVALFIMYCGRPPWANALLTDRCFAHVFAAGGEGLVDIMRKGLRLDPPSASALDVLARCTKVNPAERPCAKDLLAMVEACKTDPEATGLIANECTSTYVVEADKPSKIGVSAKVDDAVGAHSPVIA